MKVSKSIKVLVVDDSLLFRESLAKEIAKDFGIEVVGTACDAFDADDKIKKLKPDVVTLDIEMPKMDGISFLKKLMPQYPIPVIVISSIGNKVFDALDAGAVDFVKKPDSYKPGTVDAFINEILIKIKIASTIKTGKLKKKYKADPTKTNKDIALSDAVIAIGASTGGTDAIYSIIRAFRREMPGILIVQHMPAIFTRLYAERLDNTCELDVREAKNGDILIPGMVLVAPGDYQMRLVKDRAGFHVEIKPGEKVSGHCPSVDVLFDSVASAAKDRAVGVILTGMGRDGAKGLLNMRKQGAFTIGQDEETSIVYGMPMVAYNIGAVARQLPLPEIPGEICGYLAL